MGVSAKDGKLDQLRALREARFESRGGVEGRASSVEDARVVTSTGPHPANAEVGPPPTARFSRNSLKAAGVESGPRDLPKRRVGRPLDSKKHLTYAALKPWEAEGMSRATWYRRRAEARK
jgi:hypothetical protein